MGFAWASGGRRKGQKWPKPWEERETVFLTFFPISFSNYFGKIEIV
jgi:hypothetical protein